MTRAAAPLAAAKEDDTSSTEGDATFEGAAFGGGAGMLMRLGCSPPFRCWCNDGNDADEDVDDDRGTTVERLEEGPLVAAVVAVAAAADDDDDDVDFEEEDEEEEDECPVGLFCR